MTDQRNLLVAILLSIVILLGFQYFYEIPRMEQRKAELAQQRAEEQARLPAPTTPEGVTAPGSPVPIPGATAPGIGAPRDRAEIVAAGQRVKIDTPRLHGTISTVGARVDDLTLADYHVTPEPGSPEIVLLSPAGTSQPYYAEFGWVPAAGTNQPVPGQTTQWSAPADPLTPDRPVTMTWDNGQGLVFEKTFAVDQNYLFTVTQRVRNNTGEPVALVPYGLVSRHGMPPTLGYYILHEGPLGVFNGTLHEHKYGDIKEDGNISYQSTGGWMGITDKYWLVSLVPDQNAPVDSRVRHTNVNGQDRFQVDYTGQAVTVAPGQSAETTNRLFAGAKQVKLLDAYAEQYGIKNFDLAIDFGWFYFLTKPFFYALDFLGTLFGNFGVAILVLTVFVKAAFFPLANKSYKAMSKMKALQPEMTKIRERFGDDRQRMSQEMMALYKREKANPVSGCLPIVIQIPVFFALYKVLFVTIEMRHAPFFGWIHDLSAPDPTTIFNLFGLIPWTPPTMLQLGIWPIIMGITMYLQQKLNPAPPDPVQAKVFMALPFVFTFMLASFPAGLVIYWAWNNSLSILQQWLIMRRMGVKVT